MSVLDELGLSRVAVHEAGHAVVALYYSCRVEKISMIADPENNSLGMVLLYPTGDLCMDAQVGIAGELAVTAFDERPDMQDAGSGDYARIKKEYLARSGNPDEFEAYLHRVIMMASSVLRNPVRLELLLALAVNLEAKGELYEDDINRVIMQANQVSSELNVALNRIA
jgi:hypothetical protein